MTDPFEESIVKFCTSRQHGKSDLICAWASTREDLSSVLRTTNADQPGHLPLLISAYVIGLLESIVSKLATSEVSIF